MTNKTEDDLEALLELAYVMAIRLRAESKASRLSDDLGVFAAMWSGRVAIMKGNTIEELESEANNWTPLVIDKSEPRLTYQLPSCPECGFQKEDERYD